jgi:hypothetical protein
MFRSSPAIRAIAVTALLLVGITITVDAAPPPDATGQYHEWFRSLAVPGSPQTPCCSVSDCRMVQSRWNSQTQHYEAKVVREVFSNALRNSLLYENDVAAFQAARRIWISKWIAAYGDVPDKWIEIPEARINLANNPTGHAVLCRSTFYPDFNGVFCFIPYQGV